MSELSVAAALARRPTTRLAHFTPARNVIPILSDGLIRSSKDLADNAPDQFSPTDHERFDNFPGHVCCSFEYPNAYYLNIASQKVDYWNYPDWVCFLMNLDLVHRPDTRFCGSNAAYDSGFHAHPGGQALDDLWANPSEPRAFPRKPRHNPAVPTDLQAEVLIPSPIDLSDVHAIVVRDSAHAAELHAACHRLGLSPHRLTWKIAPLFFERFALRNAIWAGTPITETDWTPEGAP